MSSKFLTTFHRLFGSDDRETKASDAFAPTLPIVGERPAGANLIFRLKAWPQLPESGRTAEIYRMLSVMSSQPVNRQWLINRCRIAPQQLDSLMLQLVADGAVEVIDPARFAGRQPRTA
jgi:hypothetical protein